MPRISTPTVREAVRTHDRTSGHSARMKSDRRTFLLRFAVSVHDCRLGSVTPEQVRDFMADLDVQRSTFMKYRSHFSKFFEFCAMSGWLRQDLMTMVPSYSNPGRRVRWQLDPAQVLELLEANDYDPRNHAMIVASLNTGLRINEIAGIKYGDLDLRHGRILASISKTDEQDAVRITPSLDSVLRTYLVWYADMIGRPLMREDYLFPARSRPVYRDGSHNRSQRINPRNRITGLVTIINGAFLKAGFEPAPGEGWHTLRRTAARTFFDKAGENVGRDNAMRMTMAFLHHKSMATTERYLGISKELSDRDSFLDTDPFDFTSGVAAANVVPLRKAK